MSAVGTSAPGINHVLGKLTALEIAGIRSRVPEITGQGPVTIKARAHAVKGTVAY